MTTAPTPDLSSALDAAGDALILMQELLGPTDNLPSGFWDDPFVLGFFFYCGYAYAIRAGAGDIPFKALRPLYTRLLDDDGNAVFSQSLIWQMEEEAGFQEGLAAATRFIGATAGQSDYDEDEAVITAHEQARAMMDEVGDDAEVSFDQALFIYLYEGLFAAELRRRFPE